MYAPRAAGTIIFKRSNTTRSSGDQPLPIVKELPFTIGMDAGGRPAAVICQRMPNGQKRILREVVSRADTVTGPSRFAENINEVLLRDFRGMRCGGAWADPSSWYGADKKAGELAGVDAVARARAFRMLPRATNALGSRFEGVGGYSGGLDANTWRLLIDPSCKFIIRAYVSQYQLTKHATLGKTDGIEVEKNEYSHVAEADQYESYGYRGPTNVRKDAAQMGRAQNVVPLRSTTARSDFDVFKS